MKTMTELVSWFQMEYPEHVNDMKSSNHHLTWDDTVNLRFQGIKLPESLNPYHIEGDVWTHTMMVCKQAENAPYTVRLAALLHDIGKPDTRAVNAKNGRVSFFNHDAVGAFKALEILKKKEIGLSKDEIVRVFNLIALHTQIYKLDVDKLIGLEDREILSDLIDLGTADHEGRFHTKGDAEIPTHLKFSGISSIKRNRETTKEVVILCGLPASGKSSWMFNDTKGSRYIVSRDEALMQEAMYCKTLGINYTYNQAFKNVDQNKVDKMLQKMFKDAKEQDKVIVDMTHMSKKSRRKSLSHFGPEYKKKCVVFLTDLETLHLRNSERTGKVIDKSVIERMMRSFYPPTLEEFDEIEYVIN